MGVKLFLGVLFIVGMLSYGVVLIKGGKTPQKVQDAKREVMYRKLYQKLAQNFITQKAVRSIYTQLANLSIYRKDELYLLTMKYFVLSWGVSGGLILVSMLVFKDVMSVLICVCLAVVLNKTIIEKKLDTQYYYVLLSLHKAIGSIPQEYMRTASVVEAVNNADIDDRLKRPFDEIYTILTASNSELRKQEFYAATPFRPLQTLVGICYSINNQGDTKDVYGASSFVHALTILSGDINAEITKVVTQKKKFGFLEYLPFAPIFAIPLIEGYFTKIMPGTALIYGGPIGYIFRTLIIVSAIICYSIIAGVNKNIPVKENDQTLWVSNLLGKKKYADFIDTITPKNKKAYVLANRFKAALSRQTIQEFYVKKVVYSVILFFVTLFVLFSVLNLGGEYVRSSTQQLSLVPTNEMEKYSKETILALDDKYFEKRLALQPQKNLGEELAEVKSGLTARFGFGVEEEKSFLDKAEKYPNLKEDEVKALVQAYMPGLTDLQILDQVKRLNDKFTAVMRTEFHWWLLWLCFFNGWVGWNTPNMQLKLRRKMVRTEAEDDFLQLQTLISILMTTNIDTLDALYEMSQHSRIHKEMLTYCYHSYPANPEMELTRLQAKTPLANFKNFVGKLKLTINDLSLSEAFSDLEVERTHIMGLRRTAMLVTIDAKRTLCGPISLIPLGLMVLGELLVPLGYLGYMEFMNALTLM